MITKEDIILGAQELRKEHPYFRFGQAVFNYVDGAFNIARQIQFVDHVDCFYDNSQIDDFISCALKRLNNDKG